jgi:hypothetical protein
MKSIKLSLFAALGLLLVLPGCVQEYKKTKLMPLSKQTAHFEQTKDGVTLRVKKFDADDCEEAFSGRGSSLVTGKNAVFPLQLSIENKSNHAVFLCDEMIGLSLTSYKKVTRLLRSGWSVGGGLGVAVAVAFGASFWPFYLCAPSLFFSGSIFQSLFVVSALSVPVLVGISMVDRANSEAAILDVNMELDVSEKALQEGGIFVSPDQRLNFLVFVAQKDYRNEFSIILKNAADEKDAIKFDVVLPEED